VDTLDVSARDRWVRDLEVVRTLMLGGLAEFLLACCGAPLSGWCRALRAWTRVQDHLPGPGIGLRVSRDPAVGVFRAYGGGRTAWSGQIPAGAGARHG